MARVDHQHWSANVHRLGNNVQWVSAYQAVDGSTGFAFGQVTKSTTGTTPDQLLSRKFDTAGGLVTLYNGDEFGGGAVTEYSQAVSSPTGGGLLVPTTSTTRTVIIDVTFEGTPTTFDTMTGQPTNDGGYALQFTTGGSGGGLLGGSTVPNVIGISGGGQIKTGVEYPGAQFETTI